MSIDYQLAGFPDENGHLGRMVPAGQILVPEEIWLKGNHIRWRMGTNPRMREVSRSMLNQFLRLDDADSVLRFAQDWGILALSYKWRSARFPDHPGRVYLPGRQYMEKGAEPVSAWQYYSKRATALLNIAAALKHGRLGDMSDWGESATFLKPGQMDGVVQWLGANIGRHNFGFGLSIIADDGTHEELLKIARCHIANELGAWFQCWKKDSAGGLSDFALRWRDDQQRWDLQIDYHGLLFPAIALQLALVLADADSLYTCSGCGLPYIRPRQRKRPKSGWANYCHQCSKDGVARRRAVDTYREKRAVAVRMLSGGASVSQIAEQLNTEVARVRGWLKKGGKDAKTKTRK